ncbi:MAG TPA: RdgB/HAM1 family non-canonical purine NTP pyrophosphatase [Candidatus Thalassarchaeaceae archaeon]|nr:RdgB/HAM1 family non-canonical purine NTP pyrophosphatase [Candidatus Thalassarchaeaceae archaeon]|tara:strand:- start:2308 stop:2895 length:588 start_codon:yes stop_codon:yes gene_type:complete
MEILFATGNAHKVSEASEILALHGYVVEQLLVNGECPVLVEPQAEGIEEVALAKLEQARGIIGESVSSAVMAEDSGLFVDSLGGFPGPFSSYVESTVGIEAVLKLMQGEESRGAEYRAAAVLAFGEEVMSCVGICRGTISLIPSGNNGFGYDPIFIPDEGDGRTCGQMSSLEKSELSHRARALKGLSELLKSPSK